MTSMMKRVLPGASPAMDRAFAVVAAEMGRGDGP
jgi:hypothetical protein